jgi:hypothetical protein
VVRPASDSVFSTRAAAGLTAREKMALLLDAESMIALHRDLLGHAS